MLGFEIVLFDIDLEVLEWGLERVQVNLDKGVECGKVMLVLRDDVLVRLLGTNVLGDVV